MIIGSHALCTFAIDIVLGLPTGLKTYERFARYVQSASSHEDAAAAARVDLHGGRGAKCEVE
jgi:hypothetical protein